MERDAFTRLLQQEGFSEITLVERAPNGGIDRHTHPFEAKALILDGEIGIECDGVPRTYCPGEIFHLAAEEPHREWYGPQGVRYLVGRRTP